MARRVRSGSTFVLLAALGCGLLFFGASGRLAAAATTAREFARVERVDVEPYFAGLDKVKVYVNLVQLEGALIDGVKPEELQLVAGGSRYRQIPGIGRFEQGDELTDIIVVVELHSSFASALEELEEPLAKFLSRLPRATTRVALLTYGGTETDIKASPLGDPGAASRKWQRVSADDVPSPPQLVQALNKAVKLLAASKPMRPGAPVRKLIIVISDGNDNEVQAEETRDEFRKIVKAARAADIVFHTIFFSLIDNRDPGRNLGEISKKTVGTFRWARSRADLVGHLDTLNSEIRRQMVLTYLLPNDAVEGKPVKIVCRSSRCGSEPLESNELRAPAASCGGATCPAGNACIAAACVPAPLTGGGGGKGTLIAVIVVLLAGAGAGAVVVRKRRAQKEAAVEQPAAAALPPGVVPPQPVAMPDFSKMPYVSGSAAVQQMQQQFSNMPYVGQHLAQQAQMAQQARPAAAPAAGGKVAQIMVLSGPHQGKTLPLRHGFTVGRTPGCDLVIDDGMTSGHHAQFLMDTAGGVSVIDLGSTNGTYVNGVRSANARLTHGMSVRIGQTELRFLQG